MYIPHQAEKQGAQGEQVLHHSGIAKVCIYKAGNGRRHHVELIFPNCYSVGQEYLMRQFLLMEEGVAGVGSGFTE